MTRPSRGFNLVALANQGRPGISCVHFDQHDAVFRQDDYADCLYYLLTGKVWLTVISEQGKEATVSILGPDEIFGECCLWGHQKRRMTATVLEKSSGVRISKETAIRLVNKDTNFDDFLIRHLIKSGARTQEQLLRRVLNSSEQHLARTLVMLASYATEGGMDVTIPRVSQKRLGEMVGTTRSRVSQFMNKFRKLGYIDYDAKTITIHQSLLSVLLCELDGSEE
ncbi:Crp/Fnr family transcriptional regulator [Methyloligella sp. GL2]|uniref:Crp/Fnr family transcriptional regulator n=2 Tax=unclassified Methyloligella TaxID=2625955 RepID=UPI001ABB9C64|nr:Crp/Fnr family transcriptional regulator [Methyloligella sp. GL2]